MSKLNGAAPPFFSVLIASYNRPKYIKECLDSVLKSDFRDFEVIISDDKSPRADEIREAIEPYLETGKVKFFKQPNNLGEPANRNFLVAQASGAYNIILGDDDKLYQDSLRRIWVFINDHPGYDLYGFGYSVIDEHGRRLFSRRTPKSLEISLEKPEIVHEVVVSDMFPFWLYHPAIFCCLNGVEREIPYSGQAGIGDDFLFIIDFLNHEKRMMVIPAVLFSWRKIQGKGTVGQKNQSFGNLANLKARRNIYYLLRERTDLHPVLATVIDKSDFRLKFLFDPIACDSTIINMELDQLDLNDVDKAELKLYRMKLGRHRRNRLVAGRVFRFIYLFGVAGLVEVSKVSWQRLVYSMRSRLFK